MADVDLSTVYVKRAVRVGALMLQQGFDAEVKAYPPYAGDNLSRAYVIVTGRHAKWEIQFHEELPFGSEPGGSRTFLDTTLDPSVDDELVEAFRLAAKQAAAVKG